MSKQLMVAQIVVMSVLANAAAVAHTFAYKISSITDDYEELEIILQDDGDEAKARARVLNDAGSNKFALVNQCAHPGWFANLKVYAEWSRTIRSAGSCGYKTRTEAIKAAFSSCYSKNDCKRILESTEQDVRWPRPQHATVMLYAALDKGDSNQPKDEFGREVEGRPITGDNYEYELRKTDYSVVNKTDPKWYSKPSWKSETSSSWESLIRNISE